MRRTLEEWLAYQQQIHARGIDMGLDRVRDVWKRMGAPRLAPGGGGGSGATVATGGGGGAISGGGTGVGAPGLDDNGGGGGATSGGGIEFPLAPAAPYPR